MQLSASPFLPLNALESGLLLLAQLFFASPPHLQQLIQRAKEGESDAVAELYETYVDPIYRYMRYRLANLKDAEDLTAEVFVRMVHGLPSFRLTEAPFEAWLYRIAQARVVDYYRKHRRQVETDLPEGLPANSDHPETALADAQEIADLRAALENLSELEQTILILRFVERKSHQEVADAVGKSATAVKSIQHRALTRLASLFGLEGKARSYMRGTHE